MSWAERADAIVEQLKPEDDWWKNDTPIVLRGAAIHMLHHGMEDGVIVNILDGVIGAMREEYGD